MESVGIGMIGIGYMLVFAAVKFGKGGALVRNPWLGFQKNAGGNLASATSDPGVISDSAAFLPVSGASSGGGGGGNQNASETNTVAARFSNAIEPVNPDGTSSAIDAVRNLGLF